MVRWEGGGRYDNLVGMFSGKQVPAVGFSLGLERILLLMEEQQMFPDLQMVARLMICTLPDTPMAPVVGLAARLRQAGITVELYPEQARVGRQLATADALHIPYALIIGAQEITQRTYTLKHLATGEQHTYDEAGLVAALQRPWRVSAITKTRLPHINTAAIRVIAAAPRKTQ